MTGRDGAAAPEDACTAEPCAGDRDAVCGGMVSDLRMAARALR
ncbi:hypothetical protein [Streptomyces lavendulocolor]